MAFNTMNSRMGGHSKMTPHKITPPQTAMHQKPYFSPEDMHKSNAPTAAVNAASALAMSNQSRGIRPKQPVAYSNQLPVEGETQVEIIEARQRKERLPLKDIEDLIHLSGPLTEDAVMKTLHTRFQNDSFYVSSEDMYNN